MENLLGRAVLVPPGFQRPRNRRLLINRSADSALNVADVR